MKPNNIDELFIILSIYNNFFIHFLLGKNKTNQNKK